MDNYTLKVDKEIKQLTYFSDDDLRTIAFLINFYIINTPYKQIRKNIKELETFVKGALQNGNNN